MLVYRYKIENVTYSLNDMRHYFIDNYPDTIHLFLINNWYKVYNKDAEVISNIFHYKLFDDNNSDSNNICCGFPKTFLEKIKKELMRLEINYTIIDTSDYTYEFYDYEHKNNYKVYKKQLKEENNSIMNMKEYKDPYDDYFPKSNHNPKKKKSNSSKQSKGLYVEIGDTVSIQNLKTGEIEEYTILPTYYTQKPIGFSMERGNNFGKVVYKEELLNQSDLENNQILSESELAKKLLGVYLDSTVLLIDDNLEECQYQIIDITR